MARLTSFVGEKPRAALGVALAAGALAGAGIAAAAVAIPLSASLNDTEEELEETRADLEDELEDTESELADVKDDYFAARVKITELTKEGEVPDFTGRTRADAERLASPYDWELSFVEEPSDAEEGTIIAQSVEEGSVLGRGRSITLTVAVPPPKQWVTFQSFSGSGSTKTDEFEIPAGKVRMVYSISGGGNSVIDLRKPGGGFGGDLLVNEIGSVSGETRVYVNPGAYYLDILGGDWSIQMQVFE